LPPPLSGIIPPVITPLLDRDTLDLEGLERLIEHILEGGVQGLFILGTSGEAPSLSYVLRRELVARVCALVKGRVPILVGITDTAFTESLNMARTAADNGAQAVVLAPPYYFPAGQPELLEYLGRLVPELPLPLFLYNMPAMTKLVFEPDTVIKAAEIEGIAGLKDSSGNMVYFHRLQGLLKTRNDFSLLMGPEELLAEAVLSGGHGGVCGGANLAPRLYVDLYEAAKAGNVEKANALHEQVMEISNTIYSVGQYASSFIKGMKCALNLKGLCSDFLAEPFHRFREAEREKVREAMEKQGLL
jgi:dihydrodipicolinate synthase/N-acetylneuraminate lyase